MKIRSGATGKNRRRNKKKRRRKRKRKIGGERR